MQITKLNTNSFFLKVVSIFILLLPAAQISGPFISDTIIVISAIIAIFYLKQPKYNFVSTNIFLKLLIIFWFFLIFSSLLSSYSILTLKPSLTFIRFILFSFIFLIILKKYKNYLKYFNVVFLITLFILVIDGYVQLINGENILGFKSTRPDRLSGLFDDQLVLGSYLSKYFPIILFLTYHNREYLYLKLLNLTLLVTSFLLIFFSGERAAFLLTFIYIFITLPFLINIKKFVATSILLLLIIFVFISQNSILYDRYVNQMKTHVYYYSKDTGKIFFPDHIGLFNSAIFIFKKNFLYGSGVKTFREECKNNNSLFKKKIDKLKIRIKFCETHPHNYYLQFLAELGIIGFIFLLSLLTYLVILYFKFVYFNLIKKNKKQNLDIKFIILINGLIVFIFPFSTTGNFFNNWVSSFFFFQLSIFLFLYEKYFFKIK